MSRSRGLTADGQRLPRRYRRNFGGYTGACFTAREQPTGPVALAEGPCSALALVWLLPPDTTCRAAGGAANLTPALVADVAPERPVQVYADADGSGRSAAWGLAAALVRAGYGAVAVATPAPDGLPPDAAHRARSGRHAGRAGRGRGLALDCRASEREGVGMTATNGAPASESLSSERVMQSIMAAEGLSPAVKAAIIELYRVGLARADGQNDGPAVEAARSAVTAYLANRPAVPLDSDVEAVAWDSPAAAPPRPWLIPHWLPLGRLAILAGSGGTGKSMLALQLAARGREYDGPLAASG